MKRKPQSGRTTRTFDYNGDVWPLIDQWAAANKYKSIENAQNSRTYTRRVWFLLTPLISMVKITRNGQTCTLESWSRFSKITIPGLFPHDDLSVEGERMSLGIPRHKMKIMTNELLESLGGPPIP